MLSSTEIEYFGFIQIIYNSHQKYYDCYYYFEFIQIILNWFKLFLKFIQIILDSRRNFFFFLILIWFSVKRVKERSIRHPLQLSHVLLSSHENVTYLYQFRCFTPFAGFWAKPRGKIKSSIIKNNNKNSKLIFHFNSINYLNYTNYGIEINKKIKTNTNSNLIWY